MLALPGNLAYSLPSPLYFSRCKLERTSHYLFFYFYNLALTSASYLIWLRSGCQPSTVSWCNRQSLCSWGNEWIPFCNCQTEERAGSCSAGPSPFLRSLSCLPCRWQVSSLSHLPHLYFLQRHFWGKTPLSSSWATPALCAHLLLGFL